MIINSTFNCEATFRKFIKNLFFIHQENIDFFLRFVISFNVRS